MVGMKVRLEQSWVVKVRFLQIVQDFVFYFKNVGKLLQGQVREGYVRLEQDQQLGDRGFRLRRVEEEFDFGRFLVFFGQLSIWDLFYSFFFSYVVFVYFGLFLLLMCFMDYSRWLFWFWQLRFYFLRGFLWVCCLFGK